MKDSDLKGNTIFEGGRGGGGMKEIIINQLSKCTNNNIKKNKKKKNMRKRRGNGAIIINGDDDLLCEILSRIPAKSLMRLKCVSKRWRSLIQHNPYFTDLHSTRSRTRPSLLLGSYLIGGSFSGQCILSADLFEDRAVVQTKFNIDDRRFHYKIKGSINGLVCLYHNQLKAVRIYNPSTQQTTPWIQRRMKKKELVLVEEEHGGSGVEEVHHERSTYEFGFDPATKEHKIICLSSMRKIKKTSLPDEGGGGGKLISNVVVVDVLTVGHNNNSWRRIDEVPPYEFTGVTVYANGSIYWRKVKINRLDTTLEEPEVMWAFDIGSEKFRVIRVPHFILAQPATRDAESWGGCYDLFEVDGCVAILHRMSSYIVKLWIFDDDHKKDEEKKITTTNKNWVEEIITLPFPWEGVLELHFQAVPGTDQIIIRTEDLENFLSLHSYDRKMKTFKKVKFKGIPSQTLRSCYITRPFVENLLPLQKQ